VLCLCFRVSYYSYREINNLRSVFPLELRPAARARRAVPGFCICLATVASELDQLLELVKLAESVTSTCAQVRSVKRTIASCSRWRLQVSVSTRSIMTCMQGMFWASVSELYLLIKSLINIERRIDLCMITKKNTHAYTGQNCESGLNIIQCANNRCGICKHKKYVNICITCYNKTRCSLLTFSPFVIIIQLLFLYYNLVTHRCNHFL